MGKAKRERTLPDSHAQAVAKNLRVSPQKLNLVAQMIRGKKVDKALAELTFSRKRVAGPVKKTLESAIANAENNHGLDPDSLVVAEAYVGDEFHYQGNGAAHSHKSGTGSRTRRWSVTSRMISRRLTVFATPSHSPVTSSNSLTGSPAFVRITEIR